MESLLAHLLAWIGAHPTWAGLAIFLIALSESLVIVGVIVPGVVFMFGIGALIATGHLPFASSLAWAVAGAISGDVLSFWIGRHYKQRLRVIWPFNRHPRVLARGMDFFHRHGGKGVLLGRFVGPLRAIIPAVAGMLDMSPLRFTVANVISALLWAPLYLLPGMAFGASLTLASEVALRLVLFLLLLLGLLWLSFWLMHRLYQWLAPHAGMAVYRLLAWSQRHPRLGELPGALLDPQHPEVRALAALALLLLGAGASFAWISAAARRHALLGNLDSFVFHGLQALRTPQADAAMVWVTGLGNNAVVASVAVAGLAWLLWRRQRAAALHWLAAIAVPALLFVVLKHGFAIPRPLSVPGLADSYAYPSGHTVMATALYGFLAVMLARGIKAHWRAPLYTVAGMLIILIGFSRLYLGVHWLSDVLGGLTLGLAWVALVGIAYRRHYASDPAAAGGLALVSVLALAIGMGAYTGLRYDTALQAYAPQHPRVVRSLETWWTRSWVELPAYRQDLRGRHRHPLDVQWAAPASAIQRYLQERGWQPAPATTPGRLLQWFRPQPTRDALPVLPQVHAGREEALRLIKPAGDCLLVLRLWRTGQRLHLQDTALTTDSAINSAGDPAGDMLPLLIGNVSCLQETRLVGLTVLRTGADFTAPLQALTRDIAPLAHLLRRRRLPAKPAATQTAKATAAQADTPVLLIRGP